MNKPAYLSVKTVLRLIIYLTMSLLIVGLPFLVKDKKIIQPLHYSSRFWGLMLAPVVLALSTLWCILYKKDFRLTIIDSLVCVFAVYVFLLVKVESFETKTDAIILVVVYLSLRFLSKEWYLGIFLLILLSAFSQATYGQLQLWKVFPAYHYLYGITGSFFNSAPFAGFIVLAVPIGFIFYIRAQKINIETILLNKKHLRLMSLFALVIILAVLPATHSRAAWLSVLLVGALLFFKETVCGRKIRVLFFKQRVLLISAFIVALLLLASIYFLKKDSADGRLLIWQASIGMLVDKPLFGWGDNGFETSYMLYQANFFKNNPDHRAMVLADNVQYAYNEILKLVAELGLVGLLFGVLIIYYVVRIKSNSIWGKCSKYVLLAAFVFSLFSYPSAILVIKIIVVIQLAVLSSYSPRIFELKYKSSRMVYASTLLLLLLLMPWLSSYARKYYDAFTSWKLASQTYHREDYNESIKHFSVAYPTLCAEGEFLVQYGKALSIDQKDSAAVLVLEDAKAYANNIILYTALGDSYSRIDQYKKAEEAYWTAYYMVPNRFYPLYLLVQMYEANHATKKALSTSRMIFDKEVKIESPAIKEIKAYASETIKRYK